MEECYKSSQLGSEKLKIVLEIIKWALCSSSKIVMAQSPPFIGTTVRDNFL